MPLRVISGSAGGLLLKSPKFHPLRPTQDRIRQVIFSSLAGQIAGARVLDLFAGTGSFGIEALSRGAASAVFVEREPEGVQCIRDNLQHCRLTGAEVRKEDALAYLDTTKEKFDLIFADPPYTKSRSRLDDDPLLGKIAAHLTTDGIFVWEHFADQTLHEMQQWLLLRHRAYGETGLTFLKILR